MWLAWPMQNRLVSHWDTSHSIVCGLLYSSFRCLCTGGLSGDWSFCFVSFTQTRVRIRCTVVAALPIRYPPARGEFTPQVFQPPLRYCVLACPLWYRFRRTIKISLVVCVTVWALPLIIIIADIYWGGPMVTETTFAVFVLLPYPLLLFSLGGTMKALSVTSSVSTEEKRRIVALLVLVLLIYTVLFLPTAIWCLHGTVRNTLAYLSLVTIKFSPLADLFMYVFLRKGAVDNLLASLCCCRMVSTDTSRSTG
ncbi:mas-related G-protein coupled receptor member A4-like [Anabas testudineus]|uniref:mas-related G-protein coupled receptor member A4-like n=1 Tax=Anabas testudineus TaxID=64144 RepID=UPI00143D9010|nr:mas-related G-protein coupled receptor member A4-like [Anabas testudineus]